MLSKVILPTLLALLSSSSLVNAADWVSSARHGSIAYFFLPSPPKIARYDLETKTWLAPLVPSPARITVLHGTVDEDGIYICYDEANGSTLYRYNHSLGDEAMMGSATSGIRSIHTDGHLLFVNSSTDTYARFKSFDKRTNLQVDLYSDSVISVAGSSINKKLNTIFGITKSGTDDISYISYGDDGMFRGSADGPYHGNYAIGSGVWVFPDEDRMVESTGVIYSPHSMTYMAEMRVQINDLAFAGDDLPIALTGNELRSFTNTMLPVKTVPITAGAKKIEAGSDSVIAFRPGSGASIEAEIIPFATLEVPLPDSELAVSTLPFTPTDVFVDKNSMVNVFSAGHNAIFRWDPAAQQFQPSVRLHEGVESMTYSASDHELYLLHNSGEVGRIPLIPGDPDEEHFITLAPYAHGISMAGEYLFAAKQEYHSTYSKDGSLVSTNHKIDYSFSKSYVWNETAQKIYQMRDRSSPDDLISEQINANGIAYPGLLPGGIGVYKDSPLHETTFKGPPRPSADGRYVAIGSGYIHDGESLARLSTPGFSAFTDATWIGESLFTIRSLNGKTQLESWNAPGFATGGPSKELSGSPTRIVTIGNDQLCAITIAADGIPSFHLMTPQLEVIPVPAIQQPTMVGTTAAGIASVSVSWRDVQGETSYRIERRELPAGEWQQVGTAGISATQFTDVGTLQDRDYGYRVIALNGDIISPASEEMVLRFAAPEPSAATVASVSPTQVKIEWSPAERATGYRLYTKTTTGSNWTLSATLAANVFTATTVGLPAYTYEYKIQAFNAAGSTDSAIVTYTPSFPVPSAPVLSVTAAEPAVASLTWTASPTATSYRIERRTGTTGSFSVLAIVNSPALFYPDPTVSVSALYQYRVLATNATGNSPASTVRQITMPAYPSASTPTGLSLQLAAGPAVLLSWNDTAGETSFIVQRKTGISGTWGFLLDVSPKMNINHANDRSVAFSTTYYYRIASNNPKGTSAYSPEVAITTRSSLDHWRLQNYSSSSLTGPGATMAENGNGIPNLLKFAFNIAPLEKSYVVAANGTKGMPDIRLRVDGIHQVSFVRRKSSGVPGIEYVVEFSDNMVDWAPAGRQVSVTSPYGLFENVVWEDDLPPPEGSTKRFCRVRVTEQ